MAMKVATFSGCKVYNLSSGKSFPQWLSESKKRNLAKDEEYRRRLELIQDFEMDTATQCIKISPDSEHVIATGTYPPCVRCYNVNDLALKFHRGLTCEVIDFEILSENYGKLVFLQADRTISVHAPYGNHYSLRIPKFGRSLQYNWENCDLLIGSSGDEVYRLNLEIGQFKEPYKLKFNGCNKIHINPVHQLLGCGGELGICEFWDLRYRKSVATLNISSSSSLNNASEITALKFDSDGLTLGLGTSNGQCILYDIRSSKPLYEKEHQYGEPMVDVSFHHASRTVISTDKKIIKIWNRDVPSQGKMLTNIETPCNINNVTLVNDARGETGMLLVAGEQSKIISYFIPQLGPAPRWCNFLESLTEELEETTNQTVYEDFKFLTRQEVDELGASGLIGTPMLRGYMHGFFIEMKLYTKLRAVSKPFEYEEYRKKLIKDKIEAKRASRIAPRKRVKSDNNKTALDPRFAKLARDEFRIDETSDEYRLKHPVKANIRHDVDNESEDEFS